MPTSVDVEAVVGCGVAVEVVAVEVDAAQRLAFADLGCIRLPTRRDDWRRPKPSPPEQLAPVRAIPDSPDDE
jgi:hypothetical protein